MINVMFDVDGVLADFAWKFTEEAARTVPDLKPWGQAEQQVYNFSDRLSQEVREECWKVVHSSPYWWERVPRMIDRSEFKMIDDLNLHANVYFVTARKGTPSALLQTHRWLRYHGIGYPNVITIEESDGIARRKCEIASALGIDFSIEDKASNANAIVGSRARSYLINRPYNANERVAPVVKRINSVNEFLFDVCCKITGREP